MNAQQKVWLVTGVSSGLGKQLAHQIYQSGDIIIGTVRKETDKKTFKQKFPDRSHVFIIDLENTNKIDTVVAKIKEKYNRIDVLVNNAGYGLWGLIEEVDEAEVRRQLDVNFIATWKLVQMVLPIMRSRQTGHIIQISSRLGIVASSGGGLYAAGKFAMEGLSEALIEEVKSFGINVTLVEPGAMRTAFFGRSVNYAKRSIEDYHSDVGDARQQTKQKHGTQKGDPAKAAREIIRITQLETPPFRLPLTHASIEALEEKIDSYEQTISEWKETATRVSF